MKALAILHQLIPVNRGLEKKFFFRLHCYSITGFVRWSVGRLVCWLVGNAFVRRSTRRTLLAYLALLTDKLTDKICSEVIELYRDKNKEEKQISCER